MVNMIKRDARLAPYLKIALEDAGIEVEIDPALTPQDYAAIKVDEYYAGLRAAITPKAVDFLVVVDCRCNWFSMYILEFKNVNGPEKLNISDIQEKFANTINLFLNDSFSDIFLNDRFKYKSVKLYLVSDAYNEVGHFQNHNEYLAFRQKINKRDSLKVDIALSSKLYKFRGKILRIEYDIPPNPVVTRI
jgi:hypothetical protein